MDRRELYASVTAEVIRQIEAGELDEASPEEIDALFDRADAKEPRASASR